MSDLDRLSAYDYPLPEELIAHVPAERRDGSRLLVLDRESGGIQHRQFRDLPDLLEPGDLLVLNDTRVLPAKLVGQRSTTGGRWEGLFLGVTPEGDWSLIAKTRGSVRPGETIVITHPAGGPPLELELIDRTADGGWQMRPRQAGSHLELLESFGQMPLPPYIERQSASSWIPNAIRPPTPGFPERWPLRRPASISLQRFSTAAMPAASNGHS